jgi:hypothetical protein
MSIPITSPTHTFRIIYNFLRDSWSPEGGDVTFQS